MADRVITNAAGENKKAYEDALRYVISEYEGHDYVLESIQKTGDHEARLVFVKEER